MIAKIFLLGLLFSGNLKAETTVQQRARERNQFVPLKKLTVGPFDNYQGQVIESRHQLIFTRTETLAPQIMTLNLSEGTEKQFLNFASDSKDPAVSPDGKNVAYTLFKNQSLGEICYRSLEINSAKKCLAKKSVSHSSPFWIGSNKIAFLAENIETETISVMEFDLAANTSRPILTGRITSPTSDPLGTMLAYAEIPSVDSVDEFIHDDNLRLKRLSDGKTFTVKIDMPGLSGFPTFSADGKYIYFTQFISDTNHDQTIDANDNGVILRAAVADILNASVPVPVSQMTSAAQNCSYANATSENLYMTCSAGGSLDIYALPLTGTIPLTWDAARLWQAHRSARVYHDRLMVLEHLRAKAPTAEKIILTKRIFANHVHLNESSAALFYLAQLVELDPPGKREEWNLIRLWLTAKRKQNIQVAEYTATSSKNFYENILAQIAKTKNSEVKPLAQVISAQILLFLNQKPKAVEKFREIKPESIKNDAFALHLYMLSLFELSQDLTLEKLSSAFAFLISTPDLSDESKIYNALKFCAIIESRMLDLQQRLKFWELFLAPIVTTAKKEPAYEVLRADFIALRLITTPAPENKNKVYQELDQLMNVHKDEYALRKAIFIRSILEFYRHNEALFMGYIATNWARYTPMDDTEFSFALAQYTRLAYDRAYDFQRAEKWQYAADEFLLAVQMTDDLEAHAGFITSDIAAGQRAAVSSTYDNMKKRQFIGSNSKYVEALLILLDADGQKEASFYDKPIQLLESLQSEDLFLPVSYLLTGYCYLAKTNLSRANHQVNEEWAQKAVHNLHLAFDLSRGNAYIEASALENLGVAEFLLKNYGLAASAFTSRTKLGFSLSKEEFAHRWYESRALFFANDVPAAADSIQKALILASTDSEKFAATERFAFYNVYAGHQDLAVASYQELTADAKFKNLDAANRARIFLNYGFSQFKSDKKAAYETLQKSMQAAEEGYKSNHVKYVKHALSAVGLMAQIGRGDIDKMRRGELILEAKKNPEAYALSDLTLNNWFLNNELQLYQFYLNQAKTNEAAQSLGTSLKFIDEHYKKIDSLVGAEIYKTTLNILIAAIQNPAIITSEKDSAVLLERLLKNSAMAYDKLDKKQPVWQLQKIKLNLLNTLYLKQITTPGQSVLLKNDWKNWFSDEKYQPLLADHKAIDQLKSVLRSLNGIVD